MTMTWVAAAALAAVLSGASSASAEVPRTLSEQGRLVDAHGAPVEGPTTIRFALYESAVGGTPRWQETQTVTLIDGDFTAVLGVISPIQPELFDGTPLFLGLTVEADDEMSPRQQVTSVPFAIEAGDVRGDIHPRSISVNGTVVIDANGVWVGSPTGLRGERGDQGPQGEQGPPGASPFNLQSSNAILATGSVGIGTSSPAARLDVDGAIRVGGDASACDPSRAGAIRWNGVSFEGCTGSIWQAFAASSPFSPCAAPGYVRVPQTMLPDGSSVPSFCVMKYEAKDDGSGTPISTPAGRPWTDITWNQARAACERAGKHLIGENEWLAIANDAVYRASNWSSGTVGTGALFSGHNDGAPNDALDASANDADGYFGTGDAPGSGQRRTLALSNGAVIWDLAGNVSEWVNATMPTSGRYHGTVGWMAYNAPHDQVTQVATNVPWVKLPPHEWGAVEGMGDFLNSNGASTYAFNNVLEAPERCTGQCSSVVAFERGNGWDATRAAGLFTLKLAEGRSRAHPQIGFRCAE